MAEVPKRIHLLGDGKYEEAKAHGTITPGMLLKLCADSEVKPHDIAGDLVGAGFALEDALQGHTIDDDYADGSLVCICYANKGDHIYALLAPGEVALVGDPLTSHAGAMPGFLKVSSDSSDDIVGIALEAVDTTESAAASAGARIRIFVI